MRRDRAGSRTAHTITDIDTLLDNLAAVRRLGFAVDDEEDAEGVLRGRGVLRPRRSCAGAVSVTGIKGDLPAWRIDELGRIVRRYADGVSGILGGSPYVEPRPGRTSGGGAGGGRGARAGHERRTRPGAGGAPPGEVVLEERAIPTPGPGEVLIRPAVVGLCGTDLEIVEGSIDPAYTHYPLVLGHEWSGTVAADGQAPVEEGPVPGSLVVGEGIVPCGHCQHCRAARRTCA